MLRTFSAPPGRPSRQQVRRRPSRQQVRKKFKKLFFRKMASTPSAELVTTQGAATYARTATNRTPDEGRARKKPSANKKAKSNHFGRVPPDASGQAYGDGVCHVLYSELDRAKVANYELMRGERGNYKYVQRTADARFYDVAYYNAELGKTIALGRFSDICTASLAHALARSHLTCRTVDRAAQSLIESVFVHDAAPINLTRLASKTLPIPYPGMPNIATEDDALDFDSLFDVDVFVPGTDDGVAA